MKQLTWLALLLATLLYAIGLLVSCQSSDTPVSSLPSTAAESNVLLDPDATMPILRGALVQPQVVTARAQLESEGYAYVEANSFVMTYQSAEAAEGFDATSRGPRPPRDPSRMDRVRIDTISWLAFENPTHDLGNHTAVLHRSHGSSAGTVFFELDISGDWPLVIRQGYVSDSGLVSADIGTEGWLACVLGGSAASAVRCALSNCGWGHCTAIGVGISVVGCTVGWLVDRYGW